MRHNGIYARTAKELKVDASLISEVRGGERSSEKIMAALTAELERIAAQ
jgi:hypothetical protein